MRSEMELQLQNERQRGNVEMESIVEGSQNLESSFDKASQFSPAKLQLAADGQLIQAKKVEEDPLMQKVADSLLSRDGGRHMRFGGPTKEDKIAMQIRKSEQLIEK